MLWWGSRVSDDSQNASQRENHDHPDDVKPKFPLTQCEKRNLKVLPRKYIHYQLSLKYWHVLRITCLYFAELSREIKGRIQT